MPDELRCYIHCHTSKTGSRAFMREQVDRLATTLLGKRSSCGHHPRPEPNSKALLQDVGPIGMRFELIIPVSTQERSVFFHAQL